jgi:hypothetical protein
MNNNAIQPARRKPGKPGRKTKFTATVRRKVLRSIARGVPLSHSASIAGISHMSLQNYRHRHPEFAAAVERAIAQGIEKNLKVIEQGISSADEGVRVRCATWFLEHTQPQYFARNRVEVTGADGNPLAGAIQIFLPKKDPLPTVEVAPQNRIENAT